MSDFKSIKIEKKLVIFKKFGKKNRNTKATKIIAGITKEPKYIVNKIIKYKP